MLVECGIRQKSYMANTRRDRGELGSNLRSSPNTKQQYSVVL